MLVDLRDRILNQGGAPALPEGWLAETALRSAGGTPFAGDFVVSTSPRRSNRLEIAVVDVSGKGEQAGTRALLLSGAFGGLLGALPPGRLPARRQRLPAAPGAGRRASRPPSTSRSTSAPGRFEVRTAGHPPAAQLDAGSGRWSLHEGEGPVLGLIEDAEFDAVAGVLRPGRRAAALHRRHGRDAAAATSAIGIDRMLGQAERLLRGDFEGGADRLVDALGSRNDDRALVLVHRPEVHGRSRLG